MATHSRTTRRGGAWGVSVLGIGLAAGAIAYGVAQADWSLYPIVEILLLLGLAGTVAATGAWLARSDLPEHQCWRVASWVGIGIITMVGLALWLLLTQVRGGAQLSNPLLTLVVTETVGATMGLLVGVYNVRAVQNANVANKAAVAAGEARAEQGQLAFVHSLLRHHLFNGMQVIQSYTRRLSNHVDPEGQPHLDTIRRRSERLVTLVENMQPLARTLSEGDRLEPTDVTDTIDGEATLLAVTRPGVSVEVDTPEEPVLVQADSLLAAAFENLLRGAIERSAVADPTVNVTVESDGDSCTVTVAASGPSLDGGIDRQFLLAGQTDGGADVDLFIVEELLERYDSTLENDSGPEGPTFIVTLPLAQQG